MGNMYRHDPHARARREAAKPKKLRAVVFDVDETIIPGAINAYTYVDALMRRLADETGLPRKKIEQGFHGHVKGGVYALTHALNGHDHLRDHFGPGVDIVKKLQHVIDDVHDEYEATLKPLKDMVSALHCLKSQGVKLLVASEGPGSATVHKLEVLGIAHLFDHIYTAHENDPDPNYPVRQIYPSSAWGRVRHLPKHFKASDAGYKQIVRDLKMHASEIAMVGDKPARDILTAAKAGMRTVRVTWYTDWSDDTQLKEFFNLIGGAKRYTSPLDEAKPHAKDPDLVPDLILDKVADLARIPLFMPRVNRGMLLTQKMQQKPGRRKKPVLKP